VPTPRSRIALALVIFVILTVFIANSTDHSAARIRAGATDLSAPVLGFFRGVTLQFRRILPFAYLREENVLLRRRVILLQRRAEEMKVIAAENQRLRDALNFARSLPYAGVAAEVIGRDPTNWSNSLIINKGSRDGIKQNRAVLCAKGLVGRVAEVGARSSKVILITDPNSKVGVLIQRNRQGGMLTGAPDGRCRMVYISLDSDTRAGDRVFSAGFGEVFPKGIFVGEVIKVDREPGRLYKYAVVRPAEDLSRVEEVVCIR
jgi:rod shape-determining protein MreC